MLLAGELDYRAFQTVVYRTDLITDSDVLGAVDASLALKLARWRGITQGRLGGTSTGWCRRGSGRGAASS